MRYLIYIFLLAWLPGWSQSSEKSRRSALKDFERGQELLEDQQYQEAIKYLDSSIRERPLNPEPYFLRAIAKEHLNDLNGALLDYNILVDLNPELNEALFGRAVLR